MTRSTLRARPGRGLAFLLIVCCCVGGTTTDVRAQTRKPFGIQVVDAQTGRGVPLVTLTTTNGLSWITDSGGWIAFDEPGLLGRRVFFSIESPGYEFPADGFGMRGVALETEPGATKRLSVHRQILAERLYRVTGQGIYDASVRLERRVPLEQPVLNAAVMGQDSVQNAVLGNRLYWFWGDTLRVRYPLGHFGTAVAFSRLPEQGGLPPESGVDLEYYVDVEGFSQPAFDLDEPGMIWVDAVMTVKDLEGKERIVGHYSRMKSLGERLEHGLALFDPESGRFERWRKWPEDAPLAPEGHVLFAADQVDTLDAESDGYFYFCTPFPTSRVRARWEAIGDPECYEAWTPLAEGSRLDKSSPRWDRDANGSLLWDWKTQTEYLRPLDEHELCKRGSLRPEQTQVWLHDETGSRRVILHGGTVQWNPYRQRFVMIAVETFGETSFLGNVWYAEAETLSGPWSRAIPIAEHPDYSYYNPRHHPYFDQESGRVIYFEGTYTDTFSKAKTPTPRYNYNQLMYRLDLKLVAERLEALAP